MHYLKQRSLARAFWRSSFAYLLAFMSLFVTAGVVVYTYLQRSDENLQLLVIAIIVSLFLWILQWFTADNCKCQLCQADVMRSSQCSHHKTAKKFLGSYRLRIAIAVLFKRMFRCAYCGAQFQLRVPPDCPPTPPSSSRRTVPIRRSGNLPSKKR